MTIRYYDVEADLDDTGDPGALHAYGPVTLTFRVQGENLAQAMRSAEKALKEISKIPSTIEKLELA